ncbi:hypothetical protein GS580_04000 [Rhodococcus hoagii]|nr:hypothetical protein [Prescottella equi]
MGAVAVAVALVVERFVVETAPLKVEVGAAVVVGATDVVVYGVTVGKSGKAGASSAPQREDR